MIVVIWITPDKNWESILEITLKITPFRALSTLLMVNFLVFFHLEKTGAFINLPSFQGTTEVVTFTLLHTNDFHGHLEPDINGNGGSAYMSSKINEIRTVEGEENVLLLDAGDVYLGAAPISQLLLGESTIDIYNMMGYDGASYGNHEFDKGQTVLISRTLESDFPWLGANIVVSGTDWTTPWWSQPYMTITLGVPSSEITLGIIGLDTELTPQITIQGVTEGLVFKDLKETVLHYYDEVLTQADGIIILAHTGTGDSGECMGLETLAQELIDAGKPVDIMIGGHQHEPLSSPVKVGDTSIIEAGYFGRWLGYANVVFNTSTNRLSISQYELIPINDEIPPDPVVESQVAYWAEQVAPIVEEPIGSTYINLYRSWDAEGQLGNMVADGMLWKADLLDDGLGNGSLDMAFTNTGGLRDDIEIPSGGSLPYTVTWGDTFSVMPFGNTLYLMDLTGAQIQALLDERAMLSNIYHPSGISWEWYNDCSCDTPTIWGAYNIRINGDFLNPLATYRVVTNNFSANADGIFAEGTNRVDTYFDMQEGVNEYIGTISPIEAEDILMGRIIRLNEIPPFLLYLPTVIGFQSIP
jgi:2',3'-cyclic-nucleotide 2'-phosphodiesterase (5'-nucleotidase family)